MMEDYSKIKIRYLTCFVVWLTLFTFYTMRSNISIAMLAMTQQIKEDNSTAFSSCITLSLATPCIDQHNYPFQWSQSQQGYVLSSFFVGYLSSHLIGAVLSLVVGPRKVMIICLLVSTIATFLMVILPYWGIWYLVVGRVFIGIFSGPLYPLVHELVAHYAPEEERTKMTVLTHTGNILGLCFNFGVGGFIVEHFEFGWKYLFYMNGCLGVLTLLLWIIFVYSTPDEHPLMSKSEKKYIIGPNCDSTSTHFVPLKAVPFGRIFTSLQVYIVSMASFANSVILFALLTGYPKYLTSVYGIKKSLASYLSIIPFMSNFTLQLIYPFVFSHNRLENYISKTTYRRINSTIGFVGACAFLAPVGLISCEHLSLSILLIALSMLFLGANQSGYFTAIIDLSPRYSGIIMGFASTIASLSGVIQPQIVSYYTKEGDIKYGYLLVFAITSLMSLFMAAPFIMFGTSEEQDWNRTKLSTVDEEEAIKLLQQ